MTETPFGDIKIKNKVDTMFQLSKEIMGMSGDIGEYSDDENEVLDEIANFINVYQNTFGDN